MSTPCYTDRPRHDATPAEHLGTLTYHFVDDTDAHPQGFFVEWEVPQDQASSDADYQGRPGSSSLDLRGIGAFLIGDFDLLRG